MIAFLFRASGIVLDEGTCPIPKISPVGGRLKMEFLNIRNSMSMNFTTGALHVRTKRDMHEQQGMGHIGYFASGERWGPKRCRFSVVGPFTAFRRHPRRNMGMS